MSSEMRASSDMRPWSHGGSNTRSTRRAHQALDPADRLLDRGDDVAGNRATRRGQGHLDGGKPVFGHGDLVDQAQLIDVARDLGIVDRFQSGDDLVLQARALGLVERRLEAPGRRVRQDFDRVAGHVFEPQANSPSALSKASASLSTSSMVLYIAKDARQVDVTPKRFSSGMAQCVPARTATPERSMMVATSWA